MRRVETGAHWLPVHDSLALITPPILSTALTVLGTSEPGSVTFAATLVQPIACALEYTSVGERQRFIVRIEGSACTTRRSPHSEAAADASASVRQCWRATTSPG